MSGIDKLSTELFPVDRDCDCFGASSFADIQTKGLIRSIYEQIFELNY